MSDGAWVVVGLGNADPKHVGHRHNVGFHVLDELARRVGGGFKGLKSRADVLEGRLAGERVVLAKPRSWMNESGGPVSSLLAFYKADPERLVVVHDELDIPFGTVRLKRGGTESHNGLRSVSKSLGTRDYLRVRVGIGRPPGRQDTADFVLQDFSKVEQKEHPFLVDLAADAVEALLTGSLEAAQNRFHAQPA